MKNSFAFADDIWYSFFFSLADCGHAAVIRCFLAPAYLPAFAKEAGLPEEKTTSKYWFNYLMGQVKSYKADPPESTNEKKIIKQRIKALGTFLCDAVLNDHNLDCSDYLGKNRNVLAFPERYFQAIFPFHEKISENLLSVADTWYHTLLKTLYAGLPRALSELLSNLRSQNKKLSWMQVPEITSSTDYLSASSLLSAFALLSSARQTERADKGGLLPEEKTGIFRMVQNILEVPVTSDSTLESTSVSFHPSAPVPGSGTFSVPVFDFILFCTAALDAPNCDLLRHMYQLSLFLPGKLPSGSKASSAARDLLEKIQFCRQDILISLTKNPNADDSFYDAEEELHLLVKLERYWKYVALAGEL